MELAYRSSMTKTIEIKCRNNADARRMGCGQIRVPGASAVRHTGAKNVKAIVVAEDTLRAWAEAAYEVSSFEITES